jgi:hypothetical protein
MQDLKTATVRLRGPLGPLAPSGVKKQVQQVGVVGGLLPSGYPSTRLTHAKSFRVEAKAIKHLMQFKWSSMARCSLSEQPASLLLLLSSSPSRWWCVCVCVLPATCAQSNICDVRTFLHLVCHPTQPSIWQVLSHVSSRLQPYQASSTLRQQYQTPGFDTDSTMN